MFLIAAALVLLVRAGITNLEHCTYSDSNCSSEVNCLDVCAATSICPASSCDSMASTYISTGMAEWGECYYNSPSYFITNCTYEEPSECSDYDICLVFCTTNNGECGGTCVFIGQYVTNSSDLNCNDEQVLTHYSSLYSAFEGFSKCFINTENDASGEDWYLICNMGYPDSSTEYTKFLIPIVCITAVYCCIWFVWRRSEAEDKEFWIARQLTRANTKFFGGSSVSPSQNNSTGNTKPI